MAPRMFGALAPGACMVSTDSPGDHGMDRCEVAFAALLLAAAPLVNAQGEAEDGAGWHATAWLTSDYVFCGVSQSRQRPAGQGEVYYRFASGLYAGLWASSVDFTADDDEDDGVDFELDPFLGWEFALNDFLSADVMLVRQVFVDPLPGIDYDYNELEAKLWLGEQWFAHVAWSNDAFASGEAATYVAGGCEIPLGDSPLSFEAGAGWYDLDDVAGDGYGDWRIGVAAVRGAFATRLALHDTFSYGVELQDFVGARELAGRRFVATLSFEL